MKRVITTPDGQEHKVDVGIADTDVLVSSGQYTGKNMQSALSAFNSRIQKLESNTKWLYKYGGLGSGGSGGSSINGQFKAIVMDVDSRQQLLPTPAYNKLNYESSGKRTFDVSIYKGGGASYNISWEYMTESGLLSNYVVASPDTDYSATITADFLKNVDAFNIEIKNRDDKDAIPIKYTSKVVVNAYEFKAYYVQYNVGTENYTKYDPFNGNIFMNNLVPSIGQKKGLKIAFECNVAVELQSASYEYTNWQGTKKTVNCSNVNSDDNYENEIQSNKSKTIYLDLVDDDIITYLENNNNAALKQFYITVKVRAEGKNEDDTITIRLSDTLIPSNLYLKVVAATGLLYDKEPTKVQVYKYDASTLTWIEHNTQQNEDTPLFAVGHTSTGYVLEASEGTIIVENGIYYRAQPNQWLEIDDYDGDDAIQTIAHGNNCYTISAEDGLLIKQYIWEHPERYTAGNRISINLTPYNGTLDIDKKIFNFQMSIDGWIVNPALIENISKLTEQIQKTINPLIEDNGRDWHRLNFKITYTASNGQTQIYTKDYYIGVVAPTSFTWYSNNIQNDIYNSYFRQGQYSNSLKDEQTGKFVTGLEQIDQTINSQSRTFVFEKNSQISSDIINYDQFFSIGIQYSAINNNSTPIAVINSLVKNENESISDGNKIYIYADCIQFTSTNGASKTIDFDINKEQTISKDINSIDKFHLISILTYLEQQPNGITSTTRSILVFVDGVLNGAFQSFYSIPYFNSVTLYPGNYYVNLIECAAILHNNTNNRFSLIDPTRYYYAYDEGILNHQVADKDQYDKKIALFNAFSNAKEDIDNFVYFDDGAKIQDIAANVDMPVLMINYDDTVRQSELTDEIDEEVDYLKEEMSKSYDEDSSLIHPYSVTINWSNGLQAHSTILSPGSTVPQAFNIQFQGSSTLGYRCKNFELECKDIAGQYTVYTPNFKNGNFESFLPEHSFTLKADVVDSSHTNNNAMGSFINKIMTPFDGATYEQPPKLRNYIKTCLIGFPILLFLHTTSKGSTSNIERYYFLGIYNFNLGRKSFFNLGYSSLDAFTIDQTETSKIFLKDGFNIYTLNNIDQYALKPSIRVAEIQRNEPYYDFSQYDRKVLFSINSNDKERMFDDFVDGSPDSRIKDDIQAFVQKIAYGGGYVFTQLNKTFSESAKDNYGYNANAYAEIDQTTKQSMNRVPNFKHQVSASIVGGKKEYRFKPETIEATDFENLRNAIENYTDEQQHTNIPAVNYTSLVEYYTICMAFGLVDSVQKNLNIKSWNSGQTFYIAFYDMDTCLGINNSGGKINYYAFSDYWPANFNNDTGEIQPSIIQYDFSPKNVVSEAQHSSFYDMPSSYLFAIAKYAYTIYSRQMQDRISIVARSPNSIWSLWRNGTPSPNATGETRGKGCLCNAKYFIDTFYKSHLDCVPAQAFTLNYIYKYLVYSGIDNNGQYSAFDDTNFPKFWGRKLAYTENWFTSRLHILDAYFNIIGINDILPNQNAEYGYVVPLPYSENPNYAYDQNNDDIYIAKDIFSSRSTGNRYAATINTVMKALPYTPIIPRSGGASKGRYITPNDPTTAFQLNINAINTDVILGGTAGITDIDSINKFIASNDNSLYVHSKYLTTLIGTNTSMPCERWNLDCPMVHTVKLNNANYSGEISFGSTHKNLQMIDISQTKLQLNIDGIPIQSLSAVNMMNPASILATNLPLSSLTDVYIGGTFNNIDMPTWKKDIVMPDAELSIDSLQCKSITLHNKQFEDSSISILNNTSLTNVTLHNFSNIYVKGCTNLSSMTITTDDVYADNAAYQLKSLTVIHNNKYTTQFNINSTENEVNLSSFPLLSCIVLNEVKSNWVKFNGNATVHLPQKAMYFCKNLNGLMPGYDESTNSYTKFIIDGHTTFSLCPNFSLSSIRENGRQLSVSSTLSNLENMFSLDSSNRAQSKGLDIDDLKFFLNDVCQPISSNITSIEKLCYCREKLAYGINELSADLKNNTCSIKLNFPNCSNASNAFDGTNIKAFNKYMLSSFGSNKTTVNINNIIGAYGNTNNISATTDFLYYVIEKLTTFSPKYTSIENEGYSTFTFVDKKGDKLNVVDLSSIFNIPNDNNSSEIKYPINLTAINSLNVNPDQYVNVAGLFDSFNEKWTTAKTSGLAINLFGSTNNNNNTTPSQLNVVVSGDNNPFETFLQNVKVKSINNSFKNVKFYEAQTNESGNTTFVDETSSTWIDIGKFINWNNVSSATNLFYNSQYRPSLQFNKKIAYSQTSVDNGISAFSFVDIWDKIASNTTLTGMSFVFSNAKVLVDELPQTENATYYDNNRILYLNSSVYRNDSNSSVNTKLSSISYLFNGMKLVNNIDNSQPITFTSNFLKYFTKIVNARSTFSNTFLSNTLPYNFFNKRSRTVNTVYILSDDNPISAYLLSSSYRHELNDLYGCFSNVTFNDHIGFCISAAYNEDLSSIDEIDNRIVIVNNDTSVDCDISSYYETKIQALQNINEIEFQHATELCDCYIQTNYRQNIYVPTKNNTNITLENFEISSYENNVKNRLFVAPDIIYGIKDKDSKIQNLFANTIDTAPTFTYQGSSTSSTEGSKSYINKISSSNDLTFTGALPKNMFKYAKNINFTNAFQNINIMPTHVADYLSSKTVYDENISDDIEVPIITYKYYTFVPSNFTTNTNLTSCFNFRIFIPDNKKIDPTDLSATKYVYFVLLNDSISKSTASLAYSLPSNGYYKLYADYIGQSQGNSNDYPCYQFNHNSISSDIAYHIIGNPEYDSNNELCSIIDDGFNTTYFNSLKFDNMLSDTQTRMLNGNILLTNVNNIASIANIIINSKPMIYLPNGGQINKCLKLPFSSSNASTSFSRLINKINQSSNYRQYRYINNQSLVQPITNDSVIKSYQDGCITFFNN